MCSQQGTCWAQGLARARWQLGEATEPRHLPQACVPSGRTAEPPPLRQPRRYSGEQGPSTHGKTETSAPGSWAGEGEARPDRPAPATSTSATAAGAGTRAAPARLRTESPPKPPELARLLLLTAERTALLEPSGLLLLSLCHWALAPVSGWQRRGWHGARRGLGRGAGGSRTGPAPHSCCAAP